MAPRLLSLAIILLFVSRPATGWMGTSMLPAPTIQSQGRCFLSRHQLGRRDKALPQSSRSVPTSLCMNGSRDDERQTLAPSLLSPPALDVFAESLIALTTSGNTDVRGRFVNHNVDDGLDDNSLESVIEAMYSSESSSSTGILSPLHAYCFGYALGQMLVQSRQSDNGNDDASMNVVIGRDPRLHGGRLASAMARGIAAAGADFDVSIRVHDDNSDGQFISRLASTPSMAWMVAQQDGRRPLTDAAVMVTASHLPVDKNGFKFFLAEGGWSLERVNELGRLAANYASNGLSRASLSSLLRSSANKADVNHADDEWVSYYKDYAQSLKDAILRETKDITSGNPQQPLSGLKIVLNSGNGSGGFFAPVLADLGADVSNSIHIKPDGRFAAGVPNPEDKKMVAATTKQCEAVQADLGIMLDTDADRCGFIVPTLDGSGYQALNRNRLIALLGVAFSKQSPGCAIVTDSVTSDGLSSFIKDLGLQHVRYLKGYANVINKAKELSESGSVNAEVAIETSGHCAMKENGYIDDGTYTAVKVVSMLALEAQREIVSSSPLLKLIDTLQELPIVEELRMRVNDESLDTMRSIFDLCVQKIARLADEGAYDWEMDTENLEGIRVRFGNDQFFMLRKSLHDPIISLQIEALSSDTKVARVTKPLLNIFETDATIKDILNADALRRI